MGTTQVISGNLAELDGTASGSTVAVLITPNVIVVSDGRIMEPVKVPLVGGAFTVTVPCPGTGVTPSAFGYTVTRVASPLIGSRRPPSPRSWLVPADGVHHDLGDPAITASNPLPVPPTLDARVAALEALPPGGGTPYDDTAVRALIAANVPQTRTVAGKPLSADVVLAKADVGLGNVDNTADAAKPVSTAQAAALANKADLVGGLLPTSQIPAIAMTTGQAVANRAAMLALTNVQQGDVVAITATADKGTYMLGVGSPSVFGSWLLLNAPTDVVQSVNGQQGTVVLAAADVGAATATQGTKADNAATATALGNEVTRAQGAEQANATSIAGRKPFWTFVGPKTSAYAAQPGEFVLVDISAASWTLTLPPTNARWEVGFKVRAAAAIPTTGSPTTVLTVATGSAADTLNGTTNGTLAARYVGRGKTLSCDGAGNVTVSGGDTDNTVEQAVEDFRYAATARGLPAGGTTGQRLEKKSGTDYDVQWATPSTAGGRGLRIFTANPSTIGAGTGFVTNTTTETTVFSGTIAAANVQVGDFFKLDLSYDNLNNSAGTIGNRYRFYLGATVVFDYTVSVPSNAGRMKTVTDLELAIGATVQDQRWSYSQNTTGGGSVNPDTPVASRSGVGVLSTAVDMSADQTFSMTVTMGQASTLADFRLFSAVMVRQP